VRAAKIRSRSKSFYVGQYPLVTNETRTQWESYSTSSDDWVEEVLRIQKDDVNYHGPAAVDLDYEPYPTIFNARGPVSGDGPWVPIWQNYPLAVSRRQPYNYDSLDFGPFADAYKDLFEFRTATFQAVNIPDPNDPEAVQQTAYMNAWASEYIREDDDETEPMIDLYYPISSAASDAVSQQDPPAGSIVGVFHAAMYWRGLIENILPLESTGTITAVFEIGDKLFSYGIDGPNAVYLGPEDLHDPSYDYLMRSSLFLDLDIGKKKERKYTGVPLSEKARSSRVRIYPTASMEENFLTSDPIIYTAIAVLIFLLTSTLFIVYDRLRSSALNVVNGELDQANRKVVQAAEAQLHHLTCMSHEVRTPLNCVIGMASVLSGDASLSPAQAESIRMIVTSGELLMAIVDDVLDYSRLANGNIDIVEKRSNLQDTLSATIHSADLFGAARGVTVNPQYDIKVPECINADMRRVSQVLYNILGNAIKYSREGKTVDLHVSICSAGDMQAASTTRYSPPRVKNGQPLPDLKGYVLRLVVRDWGIGIRAEDFEKIFQPFSLIEEEAEMPHGGSGLGLSTTAKVVHALGGSISVDSVQDHWTTITVELPFNEAPVDTRMLASRLERTTVLLVGCDANERERMATILGSLPVQVACLDDLLALKGTLHTDSEGGTGKRPIVRFPGA